MSTADWIQAASLLLVTGALIVSLRQTREVGRQTGQLVKALQDSTYQALIRNQTASRETFFLSRPELLEWHLSTRGLDAGSVDANLRRLYILNKLDMHEYNYFTHSSGQLSGEVWTAWLSVMRVDFLDVPEFREAWPSAKRFYADSFVQFVEAQFYRSAKSPLEQQGLAPAVSEPKGKPPLTHSARINPSVDQ